MAGNAKIISVISSFLVLSRSSFILKSFGEMPSIGLMMPPSTCYNPLKEQVRSMASTSLMSATTHKIFPSRLGLEQIEHKGSSLML